MANFSVTSKRRSPKPTHEPAPTSNPSIAVVFMAVYIWGLSLILGVVLAFGWKWWQGKALTPEVFNQEAEETLPETYPLYHFIHRGTPARGVKGEEDYRPSVEPNGHHYFTSYDDEKKNIDADEWNWSGELGYRYDKVAAYILPEWSEDPEAKPFYHLFYEKNWDRTSSTISTGDKDRTGPITYIPYEDHFYTTNEQEKEQALQRGYKLYGAVGKIYPTQKNKTVPLYRLIFNKPEVVLDKLGRDARATAILPHGDHFYTTSEQEKNAALSNGYSLEGIAGYVYTEPTIVCDPGVRYCASETAVALCNAAGTHWEFPDCDQQTKCVPDLEDGQAWCVQDQTVSANPKCYEGSFRCSPAGVQQCARPSTQAPGPYDELLDKLWRVLVRDKESTKLFQRYAYEGVSKSEVLAKIPNDRKVEITEMVKDLPEKFSTETKPPEPVWQSIKSCGSGEACYLGTCYSQQNAPQSITTTPPSSTPMSSPDPTSESTPVNQATSTATPTASPQSGTGGIDPTATPQSQVTETPFPTPMPTSLSQNCSEGSKRCNQNGVEECLDGQWDILEECGANESCLQGSCVSTMVCTAGIQKCASAALTVECRSDGSGWTEVACPTNQECVENPTLKTAQCKPVATVCTPGAYRCGQDSAVIETCNSTGVEWKEVVDCQDVYGSGCRDGQCVDREVSLQKSNWTVSPQLYLEARDGLNGSILQELYKGNQKLLSQVKEMTTSELEAPSFEIADLEEGLYTLISKPKGYLSQKVDLYLQAGKVPSVIFPNDFIAGDMDDNDMVNSLDFQLFLDRYNSTAPEEIADFDGSGKVNSLDLAIYSRNRLKKGVTLQ